jgi:hypothetical protein
MQSTPGLPCNLRRDTGDILFNSQPEVNELRESAAFGGAD